MATRPKFAKITRANVSNASHIFPKTTLGKCRRVWRVRHSILANLANLANFEARSFYVQKNIFFCIKQSSLPLPNLPKSPNLPNSLNTCQIRRRESQIFPKNAILGSVSTRQKCRNFGKYSHSPNLLASCHCLGKTCS